MFTTAQIRQKPLGVIVPRLPVHFHPTEPIPLAPLLEVLLPCLHCEFIALYGLHRYF